jgi:hypothetical protein
LKLKEIISYYQNMGNSKMNIDLTTLTNAVCLRPQMYVGSCNFREVTSFINGFAFSDESLSTELREFSRWLGIKFRCPQNVAWFATIEQKYPDMEDALRELPKLFEEFRHSRNRKF